MKSAVVKISVIILSIFVFAGCSANKSPSAEISMKFIPSSSGSYYSFGSYCFTFDIQIEELSGISVQLESWESIWYDGNGNFISSEKQSYDWIADMLEISDCFLPGGALFTLKNRRFCVNTSAAVSENPFKLVVILSGRDENGVSVETSAEFLGYDSDFVHFRSKSFE